MYSSDPAAVAGCRSNGMVQPMNLSRARRALALLGLTFFVFIFGSRPGGAQSLPALQGIFLGDVTCADLATDCAHEAVTPAHRYLHVIVHDAPDNADWQVQAGSTCGGSLTTVLEGVPVEPNGYLEVVLDITQTAVDGAPLLGRPACFVFRGRNHWAVTFYAAYFDDSPSPDGDQVYPGYRNLQGQPDLPDLDVMYIHRSPGYAYDASPNGPSVGQSVTYAAHIQNAGSRPVLPFHYVWLLDGRPISSGDESQPLAPQQQAVMSIQMVWNNVPHTLTFETQPQGPEVSTANDSLQIQTSALTLGFWIERSAYTYFQMHQWRYCQALPCATSNSFSDWLQRQVAAWNRIMRTATYPGLSPNGVADRVRVDEVVVVPDGALPLHGGRATNSPDAADHSVDLEWGLPAAGIESAYHRLWEGPFDVDWALIHELSHARSLADLYRFDVPIRDGIAIHVTAAGGRPAFDAAHPDDPANKLQPFTMTDKETFLYQDQERDLMSCYCNPFYGAYDAVVLNRIQGRRASCGNSNPPCNLGAWFREIPPVNMVRIEDQAGHSVRGAVEVHLYFDTGNAYADHAFDVSHQAILKVSDGMATLPSDPFRAEGSTWQAGHNLLLVEVRTPTTDTFCFQEPTDMNVAYWTGYRDAAHPAVFALRIGQQAQNACHLRPPPVRIDEPFGTSASASSVWVSGTRSRTGVRMRRYSVRLVDASTSPRAMWRRRVDLVDVRGLIVASGVTNESGRLDLWAPTADSINHADDVTDNHVFLTVTKGRGTRSGPSTSPTTSSNVP